MKKVFVLFLCYALIFAPFVAAATGVREQDIISPDLGAVKAMLQTIHPVSFINNKSLKPEVLLCAFSRSDEGAGVRL